MLGIIFPGQGSQFRGMGEALFAKNVHLVEEADDILGYSTKTLCLENPDKNLNSTQFTQPALYVVNTLFYKELIANGEKPDILAGHSLGEYNALNAAGVFDFATGLKLVKKRGEIMSQAKGGGMAAVLGMSSEEIKTIMDKNGVTDVDFANFNSPLQTVISGPKPSIISLEKYFGREGVRYVPLNVSAPFHSRYMMQSSTEFSEFIRSFSFSNPSIPVISNIFARYFEGKTEIKDSLSMQISSSVRWCESMQYFIREGGSRILEAGPGNVLSQMFEFIKAQSKKSDLEPTPASNVNLIKQGKYSSATVEKNNVQTVPAVQPNIESITTPVVDKAPVTKPVIENQKELMAPKVNIPTLLTASTVNSPEGFTNTDLERYLAKKLNQITLGSKDFCAEYNVRFPYVVGGMQNGISSAKMLIKLGRSGILGFFGSYEVAKEKLESEISVVKNSLRNGEPFGVNIVHDFNDSEHDRALFELMLAEKVRFLELSNFFRVTESLILYRFSGAHSVSGMDIIPNKIIAKIDRMETAKIFMSVAPESIVRELQQQHKLTAEEADIALRNPVCDDICIIGNTGWKSDGDSVFGIWPGIQRVRDEVTSQYNYKKRIRIGMAGGFGSPQTIASAFFFGADFILTGSINQCTVEAQTSDIVKDMLQEAGVKDFVYAPSYDLFEMGDKAQVLKRGVFFPHRANKLYQYYSQFNSLSDIDKKVSDELESRYFRKTIAEILGEIKNQNFNTSLKVAGQDVKAELGLLFKWYLKKGFASALSGISEDKVNFQVFSSSAMGAFNEYARGTSFENWRNRHVDEIGIRLMTDSAKLIRDQMRALLANTQVLSANNASKVSTFIDSSKLLDLA